MRKDRLETDVDMHISRISSEPYRAHVRRVSRREIERLNRVDSIVSGSHVIRIYRSIRH